MKKLIYTIALFTALAGCKERNDNLINLTPELTPGDQLVIDSTYMNTSTPSPSAKNVLIEDFTGVRCPNCPEATQIAADIASENSGRVAVIGIHPNNLGLLVRPYNESKYDFRTVEGTNVFTLLGSSQLLPIGAIDRKKFTGESEILIGKDKWRAYAQAQLATTSIANISFTKVEYNPSNRDLMVELEIVYTQAAGSDDNYLSMAITEDKLIDLQLKQGFGVDSTYEHNHVFRKFVQPANGLFLTGPIEKGRTFRIKYKTVWPQEWNPENCHLVAFIHKRTSPDYEVVQVKEEKVKI